MSFYNGFIGTNPNSNTLFTGGDTKSMFEKNLKIQSNSWYYRNCNLSYIKNDNGHRCKNINEIDLDNYILFTGCSHTEGIGLELEKTFPYIVSKKFNCDYYNLAVAGSGPDVCFFNLLQFYFTTKKLPKFLILQFPDQARFITFNNESSSISYNFNGIWVDLCKNFIIEGIELNYFASKNKLYINLIKSLYTCPIISVCPKTISHEGLEENKIILSFLDYSRDLNHSGILSHEFAAQQLLESMRKTR